MRFISHSPAFKVQVVPEKVRFTQYGDRIVDREGFVAEFNQNDINEGDIEFAEKVFGAEGLHGRTTEIDEVTMSPLINRLSVYDTDEEALRGHWQGREIETPTGVYDMKEWLEDWLAAHAVGHPDYRQIVEARLEPPWPNYLTFNGTAEQLLDKLEIEGFELEQVLRFEEQIGTRGSMIGLLRARIEELSRERAGALEVPA